MSLDPGGASAAQPRDLQPPTILVVDDEAMVRMDICAALADRGYRCIDVADGAEALARFDALAPALVVTDIYMTETDGLEVIRQLRRQRIETPILAISGADHKYDVLAIAKRLGANATLEKPFVVEEVVRVVDALLGGAG
ncbi:response regulator transcription factor [Dongia sp.]|uniref:response regulator transcription factor n=1 Tax=Dongia sp. TaxID=1977262 RepID=UPI0037516B20